MRSHVRVMVAAALLLVVALMAWSVAGCSEETADKLSTAASDAASSLLETAPSVGTMSESSTVGVGSAPSSSVPEGSTTTASTEQGFGTVSGTVTYPEKIGLPADATVRVSLTEVPAIDPEAVVVEQVIITRGRQVPIPFELRYDLASIDQAGGYGILVTISTSAGVRFSTPEPVAVITQGAPGSVEVVLEQVTQ